MRRCKWQALDVSKSARNDGIETLLHWPKPVWEHKSLQLEPPACPNTAAICREVLSLPMSAETTLEHVAIVGSSIRGFFC